MAECGSRHQIYQSNWIRSKRARIRAMNAKGRHNDSTSNSDCSEASESSNRPRTNRRAKFGKTHTNDGLMDVGDRCAEVTEPPTSEGVSMSAAFTRRPELNDSEDDDLESRIRCRLIRWTAEFDVPQRTTDSLLCYLRECGLKKLPKTARTLQQSANGLTNMKEIHVVNVRHLGSDEMGLREECSRHFNQCQRNYAQLKDEIRSLKQFLEGKENEKTQILEDIIPYPFKTKEDLQCFDAGLSGNMLGKQRLVNALRNVGGGQLEESIRLMMKKIGSNQVWEDYCLSGNNRDKEVFQELRIYRCIRKACLLAYPERKDGPKVCRGVISTYLTQSTHHKGGAVFKTRKKTDAQGKIRVIKRNRTPTSSDEDN